MMKRVLTLCVLLLSLAATAGAQSVVGTWRYKAPAGKVEGLNLGRMGNALANSMFGSMLKREMAGEMDSIGVTRRDCSITFATDRSFRMTARDGFVEGSYKYDSAAGRMTLTAVNGHSATGEAEIDGSKLTIMYPLESFVDFLALVSLAGYRGDIPDEAMADIRAAQEESAAELKQMNDEMRKMVDEMRTRDDVSREDAERLASMLGNVTLYMGTVFSK